MPPNDPEKGLSFLAGLGFLEERSARLEGRDGWGPRSGLVPNVEGMESKRAGSWGIGYGCERAGRACWIAVATLGTEDAAWVASWHGDAGVESLRANGPDMPAFWRREKHSKRTSSGRTKAGHPCHPPVRERRGACEAGWKRGRREREERIDLDSQ